MVTPDPPIDFEGAASELNAAADTMRAYLEKLNTFVKVFYTTDGQIAESYPRELEIQESDLLGAFRAGERAFLHNLDAYPQLRDDFIPTTYNQFHSLTAKGLRGLFVETIDMLDRCTSIARQRARVAPQQEHRAIHNYNYFREIYMGDVFKGFSNSPVISRSKVENAFNQLQNNGHPKCRSEDILSRLSLL